MPFLAILAAAFVALSLMDSYPQLWWWFFGAIALLFLWLHLDGKWQRYQLRRKYERELVQRIHDERVRMQAAERALNNAYAETQTRIRSMKHKRL
jgi:hypothetical protein